MKNQNLPPDGTKVYHFEYGWGEIIGIDPMSKNYPLDVRFERIDDSYTEDGRDSIDDKHPTLSLTEYDLIKGGFTPISEWNKPKVGDVGYFWDSPEEDGLFYGVITSLSEDDVFPYEMNGDEIFSDFSPTIPEWYTEKLNEIKSKL